MAGYRVNLEIFAGPLDLLLYLVRKEELDIYDIPIAKITGQYLRYLEILKGLDVDFAGDFLVMASTLMEIKSAMLLPRAEPGQLEDEQWSDPRAELVRQLLEYKKFKDAANLLSAAADRQSERFGRPANIPDRLKGQGEPEIDVEQVSVWNLLEAFDSIIKATGPVVDMSHIKDDTPIDLYQIDILDRLQKEGPMSFERLFEFRTNRVLMIGLFLALLELIRELLVWAQQQEPFGEIYLRSLTDEPAEQMVRKAILSVSEESESERAAKANRQKQLPVEISEIPPKTGAATRVREYEKVKPSEPGKQQETKAP